jgi:hypothetical protein
MAEEFTIKSEQIESKINQLLPSQGGFGAGVDFSASTMVIPIVDLTETAEGSALRQDLQTSFSHTASTFTLTVNTTNTLINTTGYYRVIGAANASSSSGNATLQINDGSSVKKILEVTVNANSSVLIPDLLVKLEAGDRLEGVSDASTTGLRTTTRQIADLSGNLVNP